MQCRYDRAEVVHPAAFGYSFASGVDSPSFIHPSFMGYELRRAPMDQPVKRSELFFRIRKGDAVDVCPVCLVGKVRFGLVKLFRLFILGTAPRWGVPTAGSFHRSGIPWTSSSKEARCLCTGERWAIVYVKRKGPLFTDFA